MFKQMNRASVSGLELGAVLWGDQVKLMLTCCLQTLKMAASGEKVVVKGPSHLELSCLVSTWQINSAQWDRYDSLTLSSFYNIMRRSWGQTNDWDCKYELFSDVSSRVFVSFCLHPQIFTSAEKCIPCLKKDLTTTTFLKMQRKTSCSFREVSVFGRSPLNISARVKHQATPSERASLTRLAGGLLKWKTISFHIIWR